MSFLKRKKPAALRDQGWGKLPRIPLDEQEKFARLDALWETNHRLEPAEAGSYQRSYALAEESVWQRHLVETAARVARERLRSVSQPVPGFQLEEVPLEGRAHNWAPRRYRRRAA